MLDAHLKDRYLIVLGLLEELRKRFRDWPVELRQLGKLTIEMRDD